MKLLLAAVAALSFTPALAAESSGNVELLAPPSYYDPFIFKVLGDCRNLSTVWFKSFAAHDDAPLGKDDRGRDLVASLKLNLFGDGTYWGEYRESAVVARRPGEIVYDPVFNQPVQGSWRVDAGKLVVDGIGDGVAITVNQVPKVMFAFRKALHDPRLLDKSAIMGAVTTNTGPRGESIREYCGAGH
jgi:hypothetical protein